MNISVRAVAMIVLSLIIIAGVSLVVYTQFDTAGNEIDDQSDDIGEGIGCVTDGREDTEECTDGLKGSSLEVDYLDEELSI